MQRYISEETFYHCHRGGLCGVSMERPDATIDYEHLNIVGFTEGTKRGHMRLVWLASNGLHWITSDGVVPGLGDDYQYAGYFIVNLSG